MGVREFFKVLPLGIALPVAIGLASISPEDARSNLSKWAHWFGFQDVLVWLVAKSADYQIPIIIFALSIIYAATVWGIPYLKRKLHDLPASSAHDTERLGPQPGAPVDTPIWQAVAHVRVVINDTGHDKCYPATLTAIRQAALDGKIKLRGRREINTGGPQTFSDVRSDIPPEYWKVSTIGALATSEQGWGDYPHTNPETVYAWGPKGVYEKNRYADLTVNMQEIKRLWLLSDDDLRFSIP